MLAARGAVVVALVSGLCGCRTWHEGFVKQRLLQTRFFNSDVPRPLAEVDALVTERKREGPVTSPCRFCLVSAEDERGGARRYCFEAFGEPGCVRARQLGPSATRFEAAQPEPVPVAVVRELWRLVDEPAAVAANNETEFDVEAIAIEEEKRFTPRWTFLGGARTGAVVSGDAPTFTFGGQAGFRYWANYFLLLGGAAEVESALQNNRSYVTLGTMARAELSVWSDENQRFFNLPFLTFLMSVGPLVAFGRAPSAGVRASVGAHVVHVGRFLTPLFFEIGFQSLIVDEQSTSGLRVAMGLGF
ncbi:MAG: hypothetical protein IT380_25890 [Myxococcales bacterium]|nr:hypothetical protein [Myxococcales bacterium]